MSLVEVASKRRSRRLPIPGVRVDLAPEGEAEPRWTCSAIDINGDGMALSLPRDLEPGTSLRLTFQPDALTSFYAVPCVIVRQDEAAGYGAVEFAGWSEESLIQLWAFLISISSGNPV
jgi:PilZ domain-containing protein